jgi:hypothetical protein
MRTRRLMGRIYDVRRSDGLMCHICKPVSLNIDLDIQKLILGDLQTQREHYDFKILLSFCFQNYESRLTGQRRKN